MTTVRSLEGAPPTGRREGSERRVMCDYNFLPRHFCLTINDINRRHRPFCTYALMLSNEEVEAVVLGARWVARNGDEPLAAAARNALP